MNTIQSSTAWQLSELPKSLGNATNNNVNGPSFGELLSKSLGEVNNLQQQADTAVEQLFTGGNANPAEVLTAVQKADLAFRTMMQIRNKLLQAYDEMKNIRV
jgi:flagellar hook-basal body complex protein FliE